MPTAARRSCTQGWRQRAVDRSVLPGLPGSLIPARALRVPIAGRWPRRRMVLQQSVRLSLKLGGLPLFLLKLSGSARAHVSNSRCPNATGPQTA